MLQITSKHKVFMAVQPIDFRFGIDAIAALCLRLYQLDPKSGHFFLFKNGKGNAIKILAARLKSYFPRLKMIFFMDAMYATQATMGLLHQNRWEYIISLPRRKLINFAKQLNQAKSQSTVTPDQPAY